MTRSEPLPVLSALLLALLLALLAGACAGPDAAPAPSRDGPYVLVLGTAQDAGLPQIGCADACCRAAREDPSRRRLVSSLLLADPRTGRRWLFDATPDLPLQVERARGHPATRRVDGPRPPLFDGIFLTHAHMGHYAGLLHLGREAYDADAVPVHATPSMGAFLTEHGPWELLVRLGQIELRPLRADTATELAPDLRVTPLPVPHRPEYSDTVGFLIEGPERTLIYLPDIDKWTRWERPLEDVLARVDVALLDGTFFADGEVPGRPMADIPHPFISETLTRLAPLPRTERAKVWFTHLNHTNPAADPDGEAAVRVRDAGSAVAAEGQVFRL